MSNNYDFDPSYGYSLQQLLSVPAPKEPKGFDEFWQARYHRALGISVCPQTKPIDGHSNWRLLEASYSSTDGFLIRGWLLLPQSGVIKRGFVVGHGYGGRTVPDFNLPFSDAALLFPCFRGLALSAKPPISTDPYWHVRHDINQRDHYILGGCVDDLWLGVSALLEMFPFLQGHLGYLGISFSGGIGALAMAWDRRISRGHFNVPTFGNHPLRLRLKTLGSADSLQKYYCGDKKNTLKVLRYYDAALAAKRICQPMHVACALYDPCVAPPSQFAIFNALPESKQLFTLTAGHHSYAGQQREEKALLSELDTFFSPLRAG